MRGLPRPELVQAYIETFKGENADLVLGDLAVFCNSQETTAKHGQDGKIDPIAMAVAEGRRQVLMHITAGLHMTESEIWRRADLERQFRRAALNAA